MKYPPFCDIIVVGFLGESEQEIINSSNYFYSLLSKNLDKYQIKVFPAMPSPIDKIQNKFRWRIIAKGKVTPEVTIIINKCLQNIYQKNLKYTGIYVDVNPNNMM